MNFEVIKKTGADGPYFVVKLHVDERISPFIVVCDDENDIPQVKEELLLDYKELLEENGILAQ